MWGRIGARGDDCGVEHVDGYEVRWSIVGWERLRWCRKGKENADKTALDSLRVNVAL